MSSLVACPGCGAQRRVELDHASVVPAGSTFLEPHPVVECQCGTRFLVSGVRSQAHRLVRKDRQ